MDSMKAKIEDALEATSVSVTDASGDGRHVAIDVVSPRFEGLGSMKRLLPGLCLCLAPGQGALRIQPVAARARGIPAGYCSGRKWTASLTC